jgi:hypothetical protein
MANLNVHNPSAEVLTGKSAAKHLLPVIYCSVYDKRRYHAFGKKPYPNVAPELTGRILTQPRQTAEKRGGLRWREEPHPSPSLPPFIQMAGRGLPGFAFVRCG